MKPIEFAIRPLCVAMALAAAWSSTGTPTAWAEIGGPAAAAGAAAGRAGTAGACGAQIAEAEGGRGIPRGLLASIAVVESGRWLPDHGASVAWPWTVTAQGVGKFYRSRAAAKAAVRRLRARGIRNIDVGCMQVNLYYHPTAFTGLDEAFDPAANVAYAADLLVRLRNESGSWRDAVGRYHSSTPERLRPYAAKVYRAWADARRRIARARSAGWASIASGAPIATVVDSSAARAAWAEHLIERRKRFADWVAGRIGKRARRPSGKSDSAS